ncbi:MAG: hypothetical protein HY747_12285 [Elusimicrobia bacterium]|nr:hypothetical protein [Elusimicrobiota bacterium]
MIEKQFDFVFVIPAKAARASGPNSVPEALRSGAGIQIKNWTPAYAGVTKN